MNPENRNMGISEKFIRFASIASLAFVSKGCVEPTIAPHATGAPKQTATETFIPTETSAPTESILKNYQANIVDVTALYEKQPTADNPIKTAYDTWMATAKEISNLPDPRIWTLQIMNNQSKLDESVVLAQSQYTHDTYILDIVSVSGETPQSTQIKSQLFAQVVMGKDGQYQNVDYYYKDQTGNNVDVLTYDQQKGKFVYIKPDGQKAELDGLGIYFGKTEDPTTGGKLLSLVPPGEDFYKTLPEGSIVNTETNQITDSSGGLLYKNESGKWLSTAPTETPIPIPFENGPSLEFSPLFPAEWHKEFTGQVEGIDIPIIIGLSDGAIHDTIHNPPMSLAGVWMTQEGTNAVADAFLRASHYRYTKVMNNDVTYEEYLDLLKQPTGGEVLLLITDNIGVRREALINPRQGFSLLISDKIDSRYGVMWNPSLKVFYGVDGQGRLLFASTTFASIGGFFNKQIFMGVPIQDQAFVFNNFTLLSSFGFIKDNCLIGGNAWTVCGEHPAPPENLGWWEKWVDMENKMIASDKYVPQLGLEKP